MSAVQSDATERALQNAVATRPARLLRSGQRLHVEPLGELQVHTVHQRNWSRVGIGTAQGQKFFLKQFVDRVSGWHERGYEGDQKTLELLGDEIAPGIRTVPVVARIDDDLVTVAPHVEMTTIDSISTVEERHGRDAENVGNALRETLTSRILADDPTRTSVWKGLDPKNIGWEADGSLWVFDFGPATDADLHRAAARAMAAGLLCRWVARPGRHLVWPEPSILYGVCRPLAELTSLDAVIAELDTHAELRRREPQRTGYAAAATKVGLHTLGRVHWKVLHRHAARIFEGG
jgi:hypothetical protein